MPIAKGEFTVKLTPMKGEDGDLKCMKLAKEFTTGDMRGLSTGQMMMDGVAENGSRVYVALETFKGTLGTREGSFIMAHRGTMTKDDKQLDILIVPQSGTAALAGITGTAQIDVEEDGTHKYVLNYTLPDAENVPAQA